MTDRRISLLAWVLFTGGTTAIRLDAETLSPELDLWLRESDPGRVYENDTLWVATAGAVGEKRWGVTEWDISGLAEITSAFLEFNPRTRADGNSVQVAALIAPGVAGLTWNGYQASRAGHETPFAEFGGLTVPPAGLAFGVYTRSDEATESDLAILNNLRVTSGRLAIVFKATTGAMEWNDGANAGGGGFAADLPVRLVVEQRASGGSQLPGDCNQDGGLDISDGICLLGILFLGQGEPPCGESIPDAGNAALFDWQQDNGVDLSDAVALFSHLFLGGPAHGLGTECASTPGCESACGV